MKKIVLLALGMYLGLLGAASVEETLGQISTAKQQLLTQEALLDAKLNELSQSDPRFAPQDDFETDAAYEARKKQTAPELVKLQKLYLDEVSQRLSALRSLSFESENITVSLGKYDANNKVWNIQVSHSDYLELDREIQLSIEPSDAKSIKDNWNRVLKTGTFCIDPGDKIGLAAISLKDPVTNIQASYEFQPAWTSGMEEVNKTAVSPDGRFLAIVSDYRKLTIIDLTSLKVVANIPHSMFISSLSFSNDSRFLATGETGGTAYFSEKRARVFSVPDFELVNSFGWDAIEANTANVYGVALNHDGSRLAAIVERGQSCVINVSTGEEVLSWGPGVYQRYATGRADNGPLLIYSADGKEMLADNGDGKLVLLRAGDMSILKSAKLVTTQDSFQDNRIFEGAFSPDSKYIVAVSAAGEGVLLARDTFKIKKEWDLIKPDTNWESEYADPSVAFSPDGRYLAISGFGETKIVEMGKLKTVKTFPVSGYVGFLAGNRHLMINDSVYRTGLDAEQVADAGIAKLPASLDATFSFSDSSGNGYLEALENGVIKLTVTNKGQGPANGLAVNFSPLSLPGLSYQKAFITEIPAGKTVTMDIPIEARIDVTDATHTLTISFEEARGFLPAPLSLTFSTRAYRKPELVISETGINDGNMNGKIESGELISLTLRFKNQGAGTASGVFAKFHVGDNVVLTDKHPKTQPIGNLKPGQTLDLPLEFFINDRCANEIPLYVDLSEDSGMASVNKLRVPITKSETTRPISQLVVSGIDEVSRPDGSAALSVDVEQNLPAAKVTRPHDYAVVFGVESYPAPVPRAVFAARDATWFREYATITLGIPSENIYYRVNEGVTKNEFDKVFGTRGWLDLRAGSGSRVYFYFSGHGIPSDSDSKAYILPYDADPNYAALTAYPLQSVYDGLSRLKSSHNYVFLDACFTGQARENQALYATSRPVFIAPQKLEAPSSVSVFSASDSRQMSNAWPDKQHGLFTYFLLKGLQGSGDENQDGRLSLRELQDYLGREVKSQAAKLDKEQTPQLSSQDLDHILLEY